MPAHERGVGAVRGGPCPAPARGPEAGGVRRFCEWLQACADALRNLEAAAQQATEALPRRAVAPEPTAEADPPAPHTSETAALAKLCGPCLNALHHASSELEAQTDALWPDPPRNLAAQIRLAASAQQPAAAPLRSLTAAYAGATRQLTALLAAATEPAVPTAGATTSSAAATSPAAASAAASPTKPASNPSAAAAAAATAAAAAAASMVPPAVQAAVCALIHTTATLSQIGDMILRVNRTAATVSGGSSGRDEDAARLASLRSGVVPSRPRAEPAAVGTPEAAALAAALSAEEVQTALAAALKCLARSPVWAAPGATAAVAATAATAKAPGAAARVAGGGNRLSPAGPAAAAAGAAVTEGQGPGGGGEAEVGGSACQATGTDVKSEAGAAAGAEAAAEAGAEVDQERLMTYSNACGFVRAAAELTECVFKHSHHCTRDENLELCRALRRSDVLGALAEALLAAPPPPPGAAAAAAAAAEPGAGGSRSNAGAQAGAQDVSSSRVAPAMHSGEVAKEALRGPVQLMYGTTALLGCLSNLKALLTGASPEVRGSDRPDPRHVRAARVVAEVVASSPALRRFQETAPMLGVWAAGHIGEKPSPAAAMAAEVAAAAGYKCVSPGRPSADPAVPAPFAWVGSGTMEGMGVAMELLREPLLRGSAGYWRMAIRLGPEFAPPSPQVLAPLLTGTAAAMLAASPGTSGGSNPYDKDVEMAAVHLFGLARVLADDELFGSAGLPPPAVLPYTAEALGWAVRCLSDGGERLGMQFVFNTFEYLGKVITSGWPSLDEAARADTAARLARCELLPAFDAILRHLRRQGELGGEFAQNITHRLLFGPAILPILRASLTPPPAGGGGDAGSEGGGGGSGGAGQQGTPGAAPKRWRPPLGLFITGAKLLQSAVDMRGSVTITGDVAVTYAVTRLALDPQHGLAALLAERPPGSPGAAEAAEALALSLQAVERLHPAVRLQLCEDATGPLPRKVSPGGAGVPLAALALEALPAVSRHLSAERLAGLRLVGLLTVASLLSGEPPRRPGAGPRGGSGSRTGGGGGSGGCDAEGLAATAAALRRGIAGMVAAPAGRVVLRSFFATTGEALEMILQCTLQYSAAEGRALAAVTRAAMLPGAGGELPEGVTEALAAVAAAASAAATAAPTVALEALLAPAERAAVAAARRGSVDVTILDPDLPAFYPTRLRLCCNPGCRCFAGQAESELPLQRCGGCRVALYCSPACQKQHWAAEGETGHKGDCRRLKAARAAEAGAE
ncbi:hypothetical protein HYH03_013252 [Edaphochlamys debaryana]|uniref:phytol kinase n=1 Tax=Edaphochlamys debaryana TaxID=47281 RepID=A0A835XNE4_9CHLO|nr:hypothetical protein HYH03_013252 [Edaphochlamys debaryana]|eukprot:KAG2488102.1 hypothetical protein HYH03_013252 [Edaphochlamys debaryana]